jgi:arsenite-transporting ATPase
MRSLGGESFEELLEKDALHRALEKRLESVKRASKIFKDKNHLHVLFVLNPEKLPFEETRRAVKTLTELGVAVSGVIVNRVIPEDAKDFPEAVVSESKFWLEKIRSGVGAPVLAQIPLFAEGVTLETIRKIAESLSRVVA